MRTERLKGALLSTLVIASLITPLLLLSPSPVYAALTPRAPIYIDGNAGFTPENGVNGGGSGTENDPYIIKNWDISAESDEGIEIRNTTAHFVIRNCYVHDGKAAYNSGILLNNVKNGKIENNHLGNNWFGIFLLNYSDNNLILNNTCENNHDGILLSDSDNNTLSSNTCENNGYGIYIYSSSNYNHIFHNNIVNNGSQALDYCTNYWDNGYPSGGNYWSDYTGVDIYRGENQDIPGSDGIIDMPYNIPGGSNQDRYPLMNICGPFPHDPIYIDGNAGFTPENGVNGGGSGMENDPYIIQNWLINVYTAHGIEIRNTTAYFVIRNCVVENGARGRLYGIYLYNVVNGRIKNNISRNNGMGIRLGSSNNNTLDNNTCENNEIGIYLPSSNNNHVYHNIFVNNGIQAYDTGSNYWDDGYPSGGNYWSDYTGVDENHGENQDIPGSDGIGDTPYDIPGDGNQDRYPLMNIWWPPFWWPPLHDPIYIDGNDNFIPANGVVGGSGTENDPYIIQNWLINVYPAHGIEIRNTTAHFVIRNCVVENGGPGRLYGIHLYNVVNGRIKNNISRNNGMGICLYSSDNNKLAYNTCGESNEIGIYLRSSNNNHIYHNNFANNGIQADDDGSNYWDDGYPSGGNYWSDYVGADYYRGENQDIYGSDGIGDTKYYISGDNNLDRYPSMNLFPLPWTGWMAFRGLETIYSFRLEKNLDLYQGSKLVVKFYTYGDAFENENVIENFSPPWHVEENESARHPEGIGVKKVRLDLTTDDTENVISTIASFVMRRSDLMKRISEIKSRWPYASPPERSDLMKEISGIKGQWSFAPA